MAIDALLKKYDIYYTEPGATQMGFMLATTKGVKHWERHDRVGMPPLYPVGDLIKSTLPKNIKDAIHTRLRLGNLFDADGVPDGLDGLYKDIVVFFDGVRRLDSLTVYTSGADATHYFTVNYSLDGGMNYTELGVVNSAPEEVLPFDAAVKGASVILQFVTTSPVDEEPPKLINFHLTSVATTPSIATFTHTIKCDDNLLLKKNLQSTTTVAAITAFLDLIRDKECTLGDRDGNEHNVMVRIVHEVEGIDEETKRPSRFFTIQATEI